MQTWGQNFFIRQEGCLIVLRQLFVICGGKGTSRAYLGKLYTLMDISAIATFPFYRDGGAEDGVAFDFVQQFAASFFMLLCSSSASAISGKTFAISLKPSSRADLSFWRR